MTWFKVDDKLHSHRKVVALGKDIDALALWVVAGSWSADHLTDGWIPEYMVPRLLPVTKARAIRFASALELCGLWDRSAPDSEPGWQFHGWNERGRQPHSAQVLADREANAERQAAFRERHKVERNGVTNAVTNAVGNEAPTRPDPTNKEDSLRSSSTARKRASATAKGTRIPEDFAVTVDMVAWCRENFPSIDGRAETAAFIDYWRAQPGQRGVKVDWIATWRNWIRRAAERAPQPGNALVRANGHVPSPRPSATARAMAEVDAAVEAAQAQIYGSATP